MIGRLLRLIGWRRSEQSICARCPRPGHCCRKFVLSVGVVRMASGSAAVSRAIKDYGLPFVVIGEAPNGAAYCSCTKLGHEGRCLIYETRPQLCRDYEPGSCALCILPNNGRVL